MSLITFRRPGHGHRQAEPTARKAAAYRRSEDEVARLRHLLDGAGHLIQGLRIQLTDQDERHRAEVAQVAAVLGDTAHELITTEAALATAVWSNESNAGAETVQTDISTLHASQPDVVQADHVPVPQYRPYRRTFGRVINVRALWNSPQATNSADVPAGVR